MMDGTPHFLTSFGSLLVQLSHSRFIAFIPRSMDGMKVLGAGEGNGGNFRSKLCASKIRLGAKRLGEFIQSITLSTWRRCVQEWLCIRRAQMVCMEVEPDSTRAS